MMARWQGMALLAVGGMLLSGGVAAMAQEATPAAGADDHPAHIHVGSCDALDPNPTYMLSNVALLAPAGAAATQDAAIPVERSSSVVDASLQELNTGGYAINVHESVDNIGTYIACGNLSGTIDADGTLVVGLGELNDSGHSGIAILTPSGEQTDVQVYLTQGQHAATEAQASDSAAAAQDASAVEIKDLAFSPSAITIPVGGSITWTNNDSVPHTATAQDRSLLQSGTIEPGATFSQTFDTPGTIDYFCEFHANMKGSIVVQ